MEEVSFENVRSVVEDIAKEHNIDKFHINVTEEKFTGDNYSSKIVRAQIIPHDDNTRNTNNKQINLFIKLNHLSKEFRDKMETDGEVFKIEFKAYAEVLPALYEFQNSYNIPAEKRFIYPKFYKGSDKIMEEFMILEDSSYDGYKMYGRRNPIDYEHCLVLLKSLAHYHSVSFAISAKNPQLFEKLKSNVITEYTFGNALQQMAASSLDKICRQWKSEEKVKILNEFVAECGEKTSKCMNPQFTAPYNVICHGDFHMNNMLFKYKDNKPQVLFVDWQVLKHGSPATDIIQFIYTSTTKKFRDQYLDKLCDEYYTALGDSLKLYDCDIKEIYPRKIFDKHLIDLMPFGWTLGIIVSALFFCKPGEEAKVDELMDEDSQKVTITLTDEMLERLEGVVDDMVKYEKVKGE